MATNSTPRIQAKEYLQHFLYTAGDPTNGLRRHPDCDKQIGELIDFIIAAAKEEIMEELKGQKKDEPEEQSRPISSDQDSVPLRIQ